MNLPTALLVEDNEIAIELAKKALKLVVQLEITQTVDEAVALLQKKSYDVILLDVQLPDGDGYQLCQFIKSQESLHETPIIFLTAKGQVDDKLTAFASGADDYLAKPYDGRELRARVEVKLRSNRQRLVEKKSLEDQGIKIDTMAQRVYVFENDNETEIQLTPIEYKLIHYFLTHIEQASDIYDIRDSVWGKHTHIEPQAIYSHIHHLKKKLGPFGSRIQNRYGQGYVYRSEAS